MASILLVDLHFNMAKEEPLLPAIMGLGHQVTDEVTARRQRRNIWAMVPWLNHRTTKMRLMRGRKDSGSQKSVRTFALDDPRTMLCLPRLPIAVLPTASSPEVIWMHTETNLPIRLNFPNNKHLMRACTLSVQMFMHLVLTKIVAML